MFFSLNYLKNLANLNSTITEEKIIEAINDLGFEVEKINKMPYLKGIKFGKILNIKPNLEGDKLNVCEIKFNDKTRTIQTTDKNVKVSDVVIAFVPGSSKDNVKFDIKTLKGIASEGMLTSATELGLNQHLLFPHQTLGVNTYNDITDLSLDPIELLDLNDTIIEINILPNRVDANSYYVMSHELSAYFQTKAKTQLLKLKSKKPRFKTSFNVKNHPNILTTLIEANNLQPITWSEKTLLVKSHLTVYHSPEDWANLTFLMTGQPIDVINPQHLNQQLGWTNKVHDDVLINNQNLNVKSHWVLSDNKNTLLLAGIGLNANFKPNNKQTNALFVLSQFPSVIVRENIKLTKHQSLQTFQSSKLNNPNLIHLAIEYLNTRLNTSIPVNLSPLINQLPIKYLNSMIDYEAGFNLTADARFKTVLKNLSTLGFLITKNSITPPFYRSDVLNFQDLCEEIFRFYNYNNFPLISPILTTQQVNKSSTLSESLVSQGFNQVLTYALTSNEKNLFNPFQFKQSIKLLAPNSLLRSEFRNSLLISLQEVIISNLKQKILPLNLFEIGQIHHDTTTLALASSTHKFNQIKQLLINLFPRALFSFKNTKNTLFHPNASAEIIFNHQTIGFIGKLHPEIIKDSPMFQHDFIFLELKLQDLNNEPNTLNIQWWPESPLKSRDLTITLPQHTSVEKTINTILMIDQIFNCFIINTFEEANQLKITLRVLGTDEAIKKFDTKFN